MSRVYRSVYDNFKELQDMTQKLGDKIRVITIDSAGLMGRIAIYYQTTEELECKHGLYDHSVNDKNICLKCGQDMTTC